QSQHVTYVFGDQRVAFSSDHAVITMGDHSYHVSWTVYMINNAHLKKMHLTNISYGRIDSKYQNSAILRENNSYISLAEIFSFGTAMDASIAVKNLMKVNETYEIMFHLKSGNHHSTFSMNGNDPQTGSITSGSALPGTGYAMIPSGDWSINMGHVNVNWQNEMSIFHVGSVATDPVSSSVNLPFGPVTLMGNETYSIDPVIKPEIIVHCACSGGGGGGGSGGGSGGSGSPPGGTTITSVAPNVITPGNSVEITAHADSTGSGGVTLYLDVYNETSGSWTNNIGSVYVGSSTGSATIKWTDGQDGTSSYDWSEIRVYAHNSYGNGGYSYSNIYSLTYSKGGNSYVYSDNGTKIGAIINSIDLNGNEVGYDNGGFHSALYGSITSIFAPYGSYGVHAVNQSINLAGGSASSVNPDFNVPSAPFNSYFQNYENSNSTSQAEVLGSISVALSVAALIPGLEALGGLGAVIGFMAILPESNGYTLSTGFYKENNFWYESSAGVTPYDGYMCARFGLDCHTQYHLLGTTYDAGLEFKPSYIFTDYLNMEYNGTTGGTSSDPYIGVLHFTTSMEITGTSVDTNGVLYGASNTLPFTMGDVNNDP
ncbi:MAG: hypothetical protein ACYCTX_10580, partial [Thermoplasmataceae archaeon]